jgi:hypothetical protein
MINKSLLDDLQQIRHDPDAKQDLLTIMLKSFFGLTAVISETSHANHTCVRIAAKMLTEHYRLFCETPWPENNLRDDGHPLMAIVGKISDGRANQEELNNLVERRAEVGRDIAERFEWFYLKLAAHDIADISDDVA